MNCIPRLLIPDPWPPSRGMQTLYKLKSSKAPQQFSAGTSEPSRSKRVRFQLDEPLESIQ